jgi:hypothetical protein
MFHYKLLGKPMLVAVISLAVRACPSSDVSSGSSSMRRTTTQTTSDPTPVSVDPAPDPVDPAPVAVDPPALPSDPVPNPTDAPPATGSSTPDPTSKVPFDGGLSILLSAGAAYGTKKAIDYRKTRKKPSSNI